MRVICPQQSTEEKCSVTVGRNARIIDGAIGMSADDWRNKRHKLSGAADAFVKVLAVYTAEISAELECKWTETSECFLQSAANADEWFESDVCRNFSLSLYSASSVMVLAGTLSRSPKSKSSRLLV